MYHGYSSYSQRKGSSDYRFVVRMLLVHPQALTMGLSETMTTILKAAALHLSALAISAVCSQA